MSTTHSAAPNASTPQQELDALVAKVAALARLSVDLTRLSLDIQDTFPAVMMQVAAMSAASAPTVVRGFPKPRRSRGCTPSLSQRSPELVCCNCGS
ncbi:hypothetical protein B0H10DRAFT_2196848 [Mycena sp. CBHHK59/15]|nr:hypothetical protein B0H10DRAFT_2196848 [Mycena sp. CBHHK59/15]